jgi:hypothetical protein
MIAFFSTLHIPPLSFTTHAYVCTWRHTHAYRHTLIAWLLLIFDFLKYLTQSLMFTIMNYNREEKLSWTKTHLQIYISKKGILTNINVNMAWATELCRPIWEHSPTPHQGKQSNWQQQLSFHGDKIWQVVIQMTCYCTVVNVHSRNSDLVYNTTWK